MLGARFVRFHGVFHDDMFVYRVADGGGFGPPTPLPEPVYTFAYVDKVFDAVLATGARPFVELGFLPRELATQTETVFWWKAHCSPPQDMWRWVELVTTTVRHWIERYGLDEVRRVALRGLERAEPGAALLDRDADAVLRAVRGDGPGAQGHRRRAPGRGTVHERLRAGRPVRGGDAGQVGRGRDGGGDRSGRARLAAGVDPRVRRLVRDP